MSFFNGGLWWRHKRRMRVLMTTDTVGGVWTYTTHLIKALAQLDVEVTLVSLGNLPTKTQLRELEYVAGLDVVPTPFKLEWMKDADQDVEASKRFIMDVADHVKPDIFHTNQFCFSTLRLGVPNVLVAHSDMLSWWSWRFYGGGAEFKLEPFLEEYQKKVRRALLAADAIVCPSSFMVDNLKRFYDPGLQQLHIIYNGIPTPPTPPSSVRKRRMAVCVGRLWDEGKNAACIVKAAETLPDMEFVLIGPTSGPDGNYLQVTPPPNVSFTGKLPPSKVRKILNNAAIYVGPSLYEPFGLSPLEAATASCALVMSDIPSFREIWEDAALYFQPDKPEMLAEKLKFLADKPDQVCRHATMARYRAFTFYTAEQMAEQYHKLYKTLMTSKSSSDLSPSQVPHAC